MPKLPRFSDKKAVTALVVDVLEQDELDRELAEYKVPDVRLGKLKKPSPTETEKEAVASALDGDVELVTDLLMPTGGEVNPAIKTLSPDTWAVIALMLTGDYPLKPKPKRKSGRPKMTADEKRAATPSYLAKEEYRWIKKMLRAWYPEQRVEEIEELAEKIAKERGGTKTSLRTMVRKGRHV